MPQLSRDGEGEIVGLTYAEKLQDPRWQKRRLEIFERDFWTCTRCGARLADGKPFHVHHKKYRPLQEPWEAPDEDLRTLCEDCHGEVHGRVRIGRCHGSKMPMAVPTPEDWEIAERRREELKRILELHK